MRSRILINLFLFIVVITLALFLINTEKQTDEIKIVQISTIAEQDIHHITIVRNGEIKIEFRKQKKSWKMLLPYTAPAHPTRIHAILNLLTTQSSNQLSVDDVDLSQLELDSPKVSLHLNDHVFDFGNINPLDETRYVRFNDKIHTIVDSLFYQLSTNASFFINPKIITDVSTIISIQTPDYTLHKSSDDWLLDPQPVTETITANSLFNGWQQLEANTVQLLIQTESSGLINIELDDGSKINLDIISPAPDLILGHNKLNLQYHFNEYMSGLIFPEKITTQ